YGLFFGGFYALQKFKPTPAARPADKQVPLVRVEAVEARSGALVASGNGTVRPRAEVVLAAELSGRVVHVSSNLVSGGAFGAGELLVRVDAEPFNAALAQALADGASARAALFLAEQTVQRTQELIAKEFLSRQALDERLAARDQAKAASDRAEAVVAQRRLDLARTEIRAPFSGRVLSEKTDAGDTVQPGKELARIFDARELEVSVSLSDRDMALLGDAWTARSAAPGKSQRAAVYVEHGGLWYRWAARIDRVEASLDSLTRTFNLVVRVQDATARGTRATAPGAQPIAGRANGSAPPLLVGMFARVEIEGSDRGPYLTVPRAALRDGNRVWLLDANSAISIRSVRVLREDDRSVAIAAEGLGEGDRVVVSALPVVTEGMQVRVSEPRARSASQ
ncbi:MAG: efflux RND transporter periplasmic adaptor subunit, partial [Burkholderiaceae bacterium]|nr:efflux RND transporter periplasmic adaptor subunit [Burkholderiaceae bacterium]